MWDQLLVTPISDWKENVDVSAIPAKDENIWKFFVLFDKFKNPRARFYTTIKSMIVFSAVKHLNMHISATYSRTKLHFFL